MTSSEHHLLSLPREIRDIIYANLTHDFSFKWGFRPLAFPLGGHMGVGINIQNAPLLPVLLSCSQIYDEYRCSAWSRDLAMRVDETEKGFCGLPEGRPTNTERVKELCRVVSRVVLWTDDKLVGEEEFEIFRDVCDALDKVLKGRPILEIRFSDEV